MLLFFLVIFKYYKFIVLKFDGVGKIFVEGGEIIEDIVVFFVIKLKFVFCLMEDFYL